MLITAGDWKLDADVPTTRDVYGRTSRGSPADCDCTNCRNFAALGDAAFPAAFRDIAERLGINFHKAAEIHEWGGFQDNRLDYGGWFHCVGRIQSGRTDSGWSGRMDRWPWYIVNDDFKFVVDSKRDLAFDEFEDHPLVRIQFYAREAWILSEGYTG